MMFSPTIYLQKKLLKFSGNKIISGYFKGLIYKTNEEMSFDIIAGTYEKELFPILTNLKSFDNLIVIGAGDGYYAVGLLEKFKNLKLFAFEILPERKKNLLNNLKINNISFDRCNIYDGASIENLSNLLQSLPLNNRNLIVIDVEGYEKVLLDPILIPELNNCTILAEIHEHLVSDITSIIKNRFKSHHIEIIKTTERTICDINQPFNFLEKFLFKRQLTRLLGEGRFADMEWFFMEPPII